MPAHSRTDPIRWSDQISRIQIRISGLDLQMAESERVCCSSPAAMCYWFATSLMSWGLLSAAGAYWSLFHWYSASTIVFAMGIGCVANWSSNSSFHCALPRPSGKCCRLLPAIRLKEIGGRHCTSNERDKENETPDHRDLHTSSTVGTRTGRSSVKTSTRGADASA